MLLTSDRSAVADPPIDDHAGVIVAGSTRSGGEARRSVQRIEDAVPDLALDILVKRQSDAHAVPLGQDQGV